MSNDTGMVYSNQTERFLTMSRNGNKYIMIVYHYDNNAIQVEPIKNRSNEQIVGAYKQIHNSLTRKGPKPRLQRLDNEASQALKNYLQSEDISY